MSRRFSNSVAALAAVILAVTSIGAMVDVPAASAQTPASAVLIAEVA